MNLDQNTRRAIFSHRDRRGTLIAISNSGDVRRPFLHQSSSLSAEPALLLLYGCKSNYGEMKRLILSAVLAWAGALLITLDGSSLRLEDVEGVARHYVRVGLSGEAKKRIEASRRAVEKISKGVRIAYGIKTGFGELANVSIPEGEIGRLQVNLVRSHAAGVGELLSEEDVRAAMLVRANALAKGYSGVRLDVVKMLVDMLNKNVVPVIPSKGSLGASGDLAPLAHLSLVLIGEGEALYKGKKMSGKEALRKAGLSPLRLQSKEGISLINGTSVMAGYAGLVILDSLQLLKDAQIAAAMSFEALRGSPEPYDPRLGQVKGHIGQRFVASNMLTLLGGSEIVPSHKGPHKVQDPYSLRCIPQVLGASLESVIHAAEVERVEMNSANDNPLIFAEQGESLSGGNFHGQNLSMSLDFLSIGLTVVGGISERRIARLVDTHLSDLPPFLTEHSGLNSGMMILQYTAAALASENKILSHPASVDSIPTSANQEDYVSMGMTAVLKSRKILESVRSIVALEYLCAAQGLEFLRPLRPGKGVEAARDRLRRVVPPLKEDRSMSRDVEEVVKLMKAGELVVAAEEAVGSLDPRTLQVSEAHGAEADTRCTRFVKLPSA